MLSPDQLSQIVEGVKKAKGYQAAAWNRVVETARKYVQMKQTGTYNENERTVSVHFSERERYTEMFHENLIRHIEDAFLEDMLAGQALGALLE